MKALVTGATGGLGRNLVERLLSENYEVTASGRNREIGVELESQGANFVAADLSDSSAILSLCQNKDVVFHCGALSSPWGKYADFFSTNVIGTRNIINGCLQHKVKRLVYTSTPSLYFGFRERFNICEDATLPKPVNHYATTKRLVEQEIDMAYHNQKLPVITIRPRAIFGPYDIVLIPRILRAAKLGKIPLINSGQAIIDVTFVSNVVDSLLLCVKAPKNALGRKYNITNGEPMTFLCLINKLFQALNRPVQTKKIPFFAVYYIAHVMELLYSFIGKEPPFTRYSIGVVSIGQTLDIAAAKKDLQYQPRISIDEGLKIYVEWLNRHDKNKI